MAEEDIVDFDPQMAAAPGRVNTGLARQRFEDLDVASLSPLTPQVMSRQATINVGTIGHVAHGKTTVVSAISGKQTTKYKQEAKMNITIHLGYANAKIYKCPVCPSPDCYFASGSETADVVQCANCQKQDRVTMMALQRHVSFVDCPGHDILMATMLNGAAIMDAAFLLVAANETFPQPQTLEHLKAVEIMQMSHIMVLQNKIDLVQEGTANEQYSKIRDYLRRTPAGSSPVLPISAQLSLNIGYVLEYLCHVPVPKRQFDAPLRMVIVRSFDVNKPGDDIADIRGGVAGGSVQQGIIRVGQIVEVRPGIVKQVSVEGEPLAFTARPIRCKVVTLKAEDNDLEFAVPGGLIGVGLNIDPTLTRQNKLVGHVIGEPDSLPPVFSEVEIEYSLLPQVVGAKGGAATAQQKKLQLVEGDILQVNIGSLTAGGRVIVVSTNPPVVRVALDQPICASLRECVAISRRFERAWRLIGWGKITLGKEVTLTTK